MSERQSLKGASDSQSHLLGKHSRPSMLEIDSWMPNKIQAIPPLVDRLMLLVEGSQCIPGDEFDVELALREALENAVLHGNQGDPGKKVHIRCRCVPGNEISIAVTDQGKGFDFRSLVGNAFKSDPAAEDGQGIQLMKALMDDVHFERGGSEVHMRKRARNSAR